MASKKGSILSRINISSFHSSTKVPALASQPGWSHCHQRHASPFTVSA